MLGCGNVGGAVVRMLHEHAHDVERRAGSRIGVRRIAVRDVRKPRNLPVGADVLTDDPAALVRDPRIDIVVELMGGVEPALSLTLEAFAAGKSVGGAHKELVSTRGGGGVEAG